MCPSCSQHYLQVTSETVDWKDGEDPIYRTIIPIDDAERAELTSSKYLDANVIEGVGVGRQSLRFDWPKNQEPSTYWVTAFAFQCLFESRSSLSTVDVYSPRDFALVPNQADVEQSTPRPALRSGNQNGPAI